MPLVFQYGSNCEEPRLNHADRLNGGAKDLGRARTVGSYEIAFNKWSDKNGCAAGDLIRCRRASRAWGVLYEVSPADLRKLADDVEGPSYKPKRIAVRDARGFRRMATTFVVKPDRREPRLATSAAYVKHIVDGLRAHRVPEAYVQRVITVAVDTNRRVDPANGEARRIALLRRR